MDTITLDFQCIEPTDEQFYQLCTNNRDLRFERNANGDLIIMPPTGGETGNRNGRLTQQLFNWSDRDGTGIAFDSSTGFKLPNGADRSPDAAWIPLAKWKRLTPQQQQKFLPLCPDFAIELLSPSDKLDETREKTSDPASRSHSSRKRASDASRVFELFGSVTADVLSERRCPPGHGARECARMEEYLDNGMILGWLINRKDKQIEIYRQEQVVEILDTPNSLSGESVLPGFVLNLNPIW